MKILLTLADKLHTQLKHKFGGDIEAQGLKAPNDEKNFWNIKNNHKVLFNDLVGPIDPMYLTRVVKYKRDKKNKFKGNLILSLNSNKMSYIFEYLGYKNLEKFINNNELVSEKERIIQQQISSEIEAQENTEDSKNDELAIAEANAFHMKYASRLEERKFWFFFYGYDKLQVPEEDENTWPLIKLVLKFTKVLELDVMVTIDNTEDPEHPSYLGKTDFANSSKDLGILVINCKTSLDNSRQLNIKLNVGNARGNLFLGQYLNYESDGRIISGSIIMQEIPENYIDPIPAVHRIKYLKEDDKYYETDIDTDKIDRNIVQFFHDKRLNFRRTSMNAGHTLANFRRWIKKSTK